MWIFAIGIMVGTMVGIAISALLHVAAEGRFETPLCKHFNHANDCDKCEASRGQP